MERSFYKIALLILIQFSTHINSCSGFRAIHQSSKTNKEYIKTACDVTAYRRLCYKSLARQASKIKADPQLLAYAALNTALTFTKYTSRMTNEMSKFHGLNPKEVAALMHCLTDINDSVKKLQTSMKELDQAKVNSDHYELQLNNIRTWVNTALEDEDKCLDAFASKRLKGKVKSSIRKRIVKVAHLTINALALINSYSLAKTKSI